MSESPDRLPAAIEREVRAVIELYRDRFTAGGSTSTATMTIILDHTSGAWLIRHLQTTPLQLPWTTTS